MFAIPFPILLFMLFFSIVTHEFCHGYAAYLNGDNTAKSMGRLTFNPIPHIDPIGTILFPLMLIILRVPFLVGWAKPVPINPFNFRDYDRGMLAVGIAGPGSNIVLGTLLALLSRGFAAGPTNQILLVGAIINFILAFFNLIPIPPLDGSRILSVLLPQNLRHRYEQLERYGMMLVFAFVFLGGFRLILPFVFMTVSILAGGLKFQ